VDGPPAVSLERVLAAAHRARLLAPEVGLDTLRRLFTVYEAHVEAFAAHRPRPWGGRTVLFTAADAPHGAAVDLDRWRRYAGALEVQPVAGDHFTILKGASARSVAEHLERILWRPAPAGRPR
jgi:thioesterase domain-containing protein